MFEINRTLEILLIQYVYIYRHRTMAEAALCMILISQQQRKKRAEEKVLLSENVQIKIILDNTFRFLIASSGIARQGLNSLFVNLKFVQNQYFSLFFVCCSKLVCVRSDSFVPARVTYSFSPQ